MEKARKILYMFSGVLKVVGGACCALLGLLVFLIQGLIEKVFTESENMLAEMSKDLASVDPKYQYLIDGGQEVQLEFVMKVCNIFAICLIVFALIYIGLGILNILLSRKTGRLMHEKRKEIFLMIFCWLFNFLTLSTILTTVAAFLHSKKKGVDTHGGADIESYHV